MLLKVYKLNIIYIKQCECNNPKRSNIANYYFLAQKLNNFSMFYTKINMI